MKFNLVEKPWLPVLNLDGQEELLSLLEIFQHPNRYRKVVGDIPPQGVAIQSLLLAVKYAALRPEDFEDWSEYYRDPRSTCDAVCAYLREHVNDFELFDSVNPFMQVADLRTAKDEVSSLDKLILDVPNGEPLFTTRTHEGIEAISPAEAARWLITCQAYDPSGIRSGVVGDTSVKAGKSYPIGTGWAGSVGRLSVQGQNLWETLMLNLVPYDHLSDLCDIDDDLPVWERPPQTVGDEGRLPQGPADIYTWQSRRARLVVNDKNDTVVGVVLSNGNKLDMAAGVQYEPAVGQRYSEPQSKKRGLDTYMPIIPQPSDTMWLGLSAFFPQLQLETERYTKDGKRTRFPAPLVKWLKETLVAGQVYSDRLIPLAVHAVQYGTQSAVVTDLVDDVMVVPDYLFSTLDEQDEASDHKNRVLRIQESVETATVVVKHLAVFARKVKWLCGESDEDKLKDFYMQSRSSFNHRVDEEFRDWLPRTGEYATVEDWRIPWHTRLFDMANSLRKEIAEHANSQVYGGRFEGDNFTDIGRAEAILSYQLCKELHSAAQITQPSKDERTVHGNS